MLAQIFFPPASDFLGIASDIAGVLSIVYYRKIRTYRLLDQLTQEYYETVYFYKDERHTQYLGSVQSGTSTVWFG